MWNPRKARRDVALTDAELEPEMAVSILDRSANSVTSTLDRFRAEEVRLERDIAELTERLRQTRVAITAFDAAGAILEGGKDVAASPPAKIGRLVPRAVPEQPTIVHTHTDIRA